MQDINALRIGEALAQGAPGHTLTLLYFYLEAPPKQETRISHAMQMCPFPAELAESVATLPAALQSEFPDLFVDWLASVFPLESLAAPAG